MESIIIVGMVLVGIGMFFIFLWSRESKAKADGNPHSAAVIAIYFYPERYEAKDSDWQKLWSSMSQHERLLCSRIAERVRESRSYIGID